MRLESLSEVLEGELEQAVQVKDQKSLHRYIMLLTENFGRKEQNEREHQDFRDAVLKLDRKMEITLTEMRAGWARMDERFESMQVQMDRRFDDTNKRFDDVNRHFEDVNKRFDDVNRRFEDVNKRFDDVNKRFDMQFRFVTIGFTILAIIMSLYRFTV
jgi:uncharacterized coiled-coil DUF342 family protein